MPTPTPSPDKKRPTATPGPFGGLRFSRVFDTKLARRSMWRALAVGCPEFSAAVHCSAPLQIEQMVEALGRQASHTRTKSEYVLLGEVDSRTAQMPPSPILACKFTVGPETGVYCWVSKDWMFPDRTYVLCSVCRRTPQEYQLVGQYCLIAEHKELLRAWT